MNEQELIETLAEKEHAGWAHWMEYLFSKCIINDLGEAIIPAPLVERWHRQLATPYERLTEREKQSDRDEVAHILPIIQRYAKKPHWSIEALEQAARIQSAIAKPEHPGRPS